MYFVGGCFQARIQRGNILLKQGNTQEARDDFQAVVRLAYPHYFSYRFMYCTCIATRVVRGLHALVMDMNIMAVLGFR